jgi:two-component system chemotaxis response regulator CheY
MGKKILVVDDFKNSLAVLKMTLEMKKYEVATATNGQDALSLLRSQKFDLLITDFNMPVMNGLELVKNLKSDEAFIRFPVIVVSTEIDETKKHEAFKAGVTFWLKKPFNAEMFIKAVEKVLG